MANSKNLSFIEPKQERSKKRFEEVLKTAEFIYTHQENYALTVQDVSKLTGMKRPSIYKFFPSNESILEALSFKYASDLFRLIKKNLNNLQYKDNKELIKVVIDVCAIYANKNYPFSNLIFNEFSKEFLIKNIQELILHKNQDEQTKIMLTLSVLMSCLGDYLNQEDSITPRCISETKKYVFYIYLISRLQLAC